MEETLISFETAKLAKLKGFIGKWCTTYYKVDGKLGYIAYYEYYDNNEDDNPMVFDKVKPLCEAPTQSLLQKYLRDVHNIAIIIEFDFDYEIHDKKQCHYIYNILNVNLENIDVLHVDDYHYNTYELALEAGLQHALNLI